ncbi:uS15 family ribosomal protein [Candidatus Karelsulcia muelleri]|nr:30S ribosomal protein S15 [Candidatus Karelsulcia muelleri]WDE42238.1 uS15 family ribosomal protein [Candidatus Karelsulcia muelleri]WDR79085.1 uS15 family ribosomal protein [Candidatus Karelsulcia muelleri]
MKISEMFLKTNNLKLDTGSNIAQLFYLNKKIKKMTNHLKHNKHDYNTYRFLLKKVSNKKKLLKLLLK